VAYSCQASGGCPGAVWRTSHGPLYGTRWNTMRGGGRMQWSCFAKLNQAIQLRTCGRDAKGYLPAELLLDDQPSLDCAATDRV
jgi:hypothetical protein